MLRRSIALLTLVMAVGAACTAGTAPTRQGSAGGTDSEGAPLADRVPIADPVADPPAFRDLIVAASPSGLIALDSLSGKVLFDGKGVPAFADWSRLFTAEHSRGMTVVREVRPGNGRERPTATIPGTWDVRVVSSDGSRIALMTPLPEGADPRIPVPTAETRLVVASEGGAVQRFRLEGNFEPEAFSGNGRSLFMISHIPAMNPTSYRVARLQMGTGKVVSVLTASKVNPVVETMAGTRLHQAPSLDGSALYTLYTTQPPSYGNHHASAARTTEHLAFVHTLNVRNGWAHCIGLPRELWGGDSRSEAISVTPDGRFVYVVDTARDFVAVMNTQRLRVVRSAEIDFPASSAQTRAAISPDGTELLVSTGDRLTRLDVATLDPRLEESWDLGEEITGLTFAAQGDRLYMATPQRVSLISSIDGTTLRSVAANGLEDLYYAAKLTA